MNGAALTDPTASNSSISLNCIHANLFFETPGDARIGSTNTLKRSRPIPFFLLSSANAATETETVCMYDATWRKKEWTAPKTVLLYFSKFLLLSSIRLKCVLAHWAKFAKTRCFRSSLNGDVDATPRVQNEQSWCLCVGCRRWTRLLTCTTNYCSCKTLLLLALPLCMTLLTLLPYIFWTVFQTPASFITHGCGGWLERMEIAIRWERQLSVVYNGMNWMFNRGNSNTCFRRLCASSTDLPMERNWHSWEEIHAWNAFTYFPAGVFGGKLFAGWTLTLTIEVTYEN